MSRPDTMATVLRRLSALEARVSDLEGPYAETAYQTRREVIGLRITLGRLAEQAGVQVATDEEIDAALEDEDR